MPERGFKCRVVTKSPYSAVGVGDHLRRTLFKALRRDKRVSITLEGDHEHAVETAFENALSISSFWSNLTDLEELHHNENLSRKPVPGIIAAKGLKVLSSDLSAASDLLPLDLVSSLVNGFL